MLTVQEVTHIKIKDTICYNEMRLLGAVRCPLDVAFF